MTAVRHLVLAAVMAVALHLGGYTDTAQAAKDRKTCSVFKAVNEDKSAVFKTTLVRLQMQVSWCRDGKVVSVGVTCKVEKFDRITITIDSCQAQGNFVPWQGNPKGAYYAQATINYSNCVLKFGCWASAQMDIVRWLYADGSILKSPREEVQSGV